MTHVLHYAPDNASMIIRLVLEELGVPYRTVLVNRAEREQDGDAYRKLNPNGLIPVLETPQGPIFETGAILLWLSEHHKGLAPAPASAERADFLKWLFFLSNTLHVEMRMLFYPDKYAGADDFAKKQLGETLRPSIQAHLQKLETQIGSGPYLLGRQTSVLDFYLCALLRWMALYPKGGTGWLDLTATPKIHALACSLEMRNSVIRTAEAEGLGPTPFSAPCYAQPPEGTAT